MLAGNGRSAAASTKTKTVKGSPRKARKIAQETKATESVFDGKTKQMFKKFLNGANTTTVEEKVSPYENLRAFGITQPIQLRKSKSAEMPMDGDSFDYDQLLNGYKQIGGGDRKTTKKSKKKFLESKDQSGATTKVKASRRVATVLTSVSHAPETSPSESKSNNNKTVQEKAELNGKPNDRDLLDVENLKELSKAPREEKKTVTETLTTPAEKSQVSKAPTAETLPKGNAIGQADQAQQMHQQYLQYYKQQYFRNFMLNYYRRRCYEEQYQQQQQRQQQRQQMMQWNQGQQRRSQDIQNKSMHMYEMARVLQEQEEQPIIRQSLDNHFGSQQTRRAVMASIPSGDIRDRSFYGGRSQLKKRSATKNKFNNQSLALSTLCLFLFLSMISVWLYNLESQRRRSQESSPFEATSRGSVNAAILNKPPFVSGRQVNTGIHVGEGGLRDSAESMAPTGTVGPDLQENTFSKISPLAWW